MTSRPELEQSLIAASRVAYGLYPDLRTNTHRMLQALDHYWDAYDGGSSEDWDILWWHAFERYRRRVETHVTIGAT